MPSTPDEAGATTCESWPTPAVSPIAGSMRCWTTSASPTQPAATPAPTHWACGNVLASPRPSSALLPVLILDEPGNGLDPEGIRTLRDRLRARAADGGTVFVSSHLLAEVEHLADDVIVIDEGRLIAKGTLIELQQAASLVRTRDADGLADVLEKAGAIAEAHHANGLIVRNMPIDEIGERAFAAGIALQELSPRTGSLEELFLNWTTNPSVNQEVNPS